MTIKTLCFCDDIINLKENVDKLFKTALHDDFDQDEQKMGRSPKLPDHSKRDTKSDGYIPSVPGNLLDLIMKGTVQQVAGLYLSGRSYGMRKRDTSAMMNYY